MPDRIDVQRLTTLLTREEGWAPVVHLPSVGSTNAEAAERGVLWSPVLTDHQTAGRGRLGRQCADAPGASLAMSVLVPAVRPPGWLPLLTGLAVRDALADEGVDARLKWPNDVLLPADRDRKVCGILCQARPAGGVVVGIGINVAHERGDLPVETATSLRLAGADVDLTSVAAAVLGRLRHRHAELTAGGDEGERARVAYVRACSTVGQRVVLHRPDGSREEVEATGVDLEGRLSVIGGSGSDTVAAGDVQHVRPPGASPS